MSPCQAMIQTGSGEIRQCNNKPRHGLDTCRVHKDFFRKDKWISKVLYGQAPILCSGCKNASSVFHANHIHTTIQSGRVVLEKEDVKAIPSEDKYIDIFRLLCSSNCINPLWNIKLLVRTTVHYTWLVAQGLNMPFYFDSILENENMTGLLVIRYFLPYWSVVPKVRPIIHCLIEQMFDTNYKMLPIALYDEKYILNYLTQDNLTDVKEYVSEVLIPMMFKDKKKIKKLYRMRIDSLKEELMMKMWSPERIEAYQEKYGIFLLDDFDTELMATGRGPRV